MGYVQLMMIEKQNEMAGAYKKRFGVPALVARNWGDQNLFECMEITSLTFPTVLSFEDISVIVASSCFQARTVLSHLKQWNDIWNNATNFFFVTRGGESISVSIV